MAILTKSIQGTSRFLALVSALTTLVIMMLTVVDVSSRLLGFGSVPGLLELSEVALVFLVFSGIAYGLQTRTHVAVSIVTARLPEKAGRAVVSVGLIILIALLVWALWATADTAIASMMRNEVRFGITHIPIWPARIMIPIGLLFTLGEALIQLRAVLGGAERIRGEVPEADKEIGV